MTYIEIVDNKIIKRHVNLPISYRNISNFFALSPEEISDLTWSGNPGVKFYIYIENKPSEIPPKYGLSGPTYVIDDEKKTVVGNYELQEIPEVEPQQTETVSARQIRLWLIQNGIPLQSIEDAINSIEDPVTRDSILIEWRHAPYVEIKHPMILGIASILGLDEKALKNAFNEAALI